MRYVWIAVGGALGSTGRYLVAGIVHRVTPPFFPYGTFAVNVVRCLLFGAVIGLADERFVIGPSARAFILIGPSAASRRSPPTPSRHSNCCGPASSRAPG